MEIRSQSTPKWLQHWPKLSFYEEKCKKHEKQYNTYYCGECMEQPVCDICWKKYKSKEHQDHHPILQVCSASRRAAIDVKRISDLLDIVNIQKYSINSKEVVYLNSNMKANPNSHCHGGSNCEVCNMKLMESKYRFCSIVCKNKSIGCEMQERTSEVEEQQPTLKRKAYTGCSSCRKKSRKGIPHRAPLK